MLCGVISKSMHWVYQNSLIFLCKVAQIYTISSIFHQKKCLDYVLSNNTKVPFICHSPLKPKTNMSDFISIRNWIYYNRMFIFMREYSTSLVEYSYHNLLSWFQKTQLQTCQSKMDLGIYSFLLSKERAEQQLLVIFFVPDWL